MQMKRILSSVLSVILLTACLPSGFTFAENTAEIREKTTRKVYLHAGDRDPVKSSYASTMYKNETGNIYFAVDKPNKTEFDQSGTPETPRYCLNGYTVQIYYNPNYFQFGGKSENSPIDVELPNKHFPNGTLPSAEDDPDAKDWCYRVVENNLSANETIIDGERYQSAYVTVLFQGFYLPDKTEEGWYDLCALPLTPTKKGTTNVYINIYQEKEHQLELIAKNETDLPEDQTFDYTLMNGGMHTIEITDRGTPVPPSASPKPDRYTRAQEVALSAEEGCTIWWKDDTMGDFKEYNPEEKISVKSSTTIQCYAERAGIQSDVKSYTYHIVPETPRVFVKNESGTAKLLEIENSVYNEPTDIYNVYASDTDDFDADIDGTTDLFYTFNEALSSDDIGNGNGGRDAFTEWVKLDKITKAISITKSCTLRLVTRKTNSLTDETEFSDVKICSLGIRPAEVTAEVTAGSSSAENGIYTGKIDVTLQCKTTGAMIYYTLDGKNPLTDGIEYKKNDLITISTNTTLRAAAKFDGQDGKVSSYFYMFNINGDYGVQAFYPPTVYEGSVTVTLTANNPENSIKYRFKGESDLKDYNGEILTITEDTTIYAKAGKEGDWDRKEEEFKYEIRPLPPVFTPQSTQFTNADKVTVSCTESTDATSSKRYTLYYTTDGTDPISNGKAANELSDSVEIDISKYTVIKAVVKKDDSNYSTVVTHSYDIVTSKPTKPMMTLNQGKYIRKIGDDKGYQTSFMPTVGDVKIYYRTDGREPVVGADDLYDKKPIELRGRMIIKAVAVNSLNTKSDTALFDYTIIPEAPKAPPSSLDLSELPIIKVEAVADDNNKVIYTIGSFTNTFDVANCTDGVFYIDLKTGNAYADEECQTLLGNESGKNFTDSAYLSIYSVLDGIESDRNEYLYAVSSNPESLSIPYADKETGEYEEAADTDGDYLKINLSSLNTNDTIQYRFGNNGEWQTYSGTIGLKEYTILQIRSRKNIGGKDIYSGIKSYVYTFVPLPPVFSLESGRYLKSDNKTTTVSLDKRAPAKESYYLYIRKNGDSPDKGVDNGIELGVDKTMSIKAYVINGKTTRKSKNTINYYIIEDENLNGKVGLDYPYHEVLPDVTKRMSADLLGEGKYAEGIKLYTNADALINYKYNYSYIDKDSNKTITVFFDEKLVYKNTPIMVNPNMTNMKITTWLTDDAGNEIANSSSDYEIEFVHLEIPETSLGSEKLEFANNTKYTLMNDYPNDDTVFLYYTLDGSDPTKETNENRKIYNGEELTLTGAVTVKAAYFSACGKCGSCMDDRKTECLNGVYGNIGEYKYTTSVVRYTGGGGGGTRVVDNTRAYTKDIFGTEHPTHISYINGYPDGSVQPDGNITREEIASVLYRIVEHEYEKPFVATGDMFSDVEAAHWSAHDIEYMAEKEIVSGYPDGEFKPQNKLTRAEFAALICRFAKLEKAETKNPFGDVTDSHWAYENILSLVQSGLVEGYEDGSFQPENEITRAEVMTVINKILGRNPSDAYVKSLNFNPYTDLTKDKWYYTAVTEATVTHDYQLDKNGVEEKWENWK